jgi:hypothetical protein
MGDAMNTGTQMFTVDKQTVIGMLKATGSRDYDVLYAQKTSMLQLSRGLRTYGLVAMITGGAVSLTLILAVIGIPCGLFGWWLWHKGKKNIRIADEAFSEYLESIGMKVEAAAA